MNNCVLYAVTAVYLFFKQALVSVWSFHTIVVWSTRLLGTFVLTDVSINVLLTDAICLFCINYFKQYFFKNGLNKWWWHQTYLSMYKTEGHLVSLNEEMDPARSTVTPVYQFVSCSAADGRRVVTRWEF